MPKKSAPVPNNELLTPTNVEHKIMVLRYKKAWEIEYAKLIPENQAKVKYAKEHPEETLVDPVVGKFVRAVIQLAESNERI